MTTITSIHDVKTVNTVTLKDLANVDEHAEPQALIHANVDANNELANVYLCVEKSSSWYQAESIKSIATLKFPSYAAARTTREWEMIFNVSLEKLKNSPMNPEFDLTEALCSGLIHTAINTVVNGCPFDEFIEDVFSCYYTSHLAAIDAISVFTTGDVLAEGTPVDYFGTELSADTFGGSCEMATVVFELLLDTYTQVLEQTDIIQSKARKPQSKKAKHNAKRKANKAKQKANRKK